MSRIRIRENNSNITYYYKYSCDTEKIVEWIYSVSSNEILTIKEISLHDVLNRHSEGNTGKDFLPGVSLKEINECIKKGDISSISLTARCKENPVIIGVKPFEKEAFITIRKSKPVDIIELEKVLGLD